MNEFMIRLCSVPDVENFVSFATSLNFKVFVSDGHQTVNGKSFMQMFCLDLSHPLTVTADCCEDTLRQLHQRVTQLLAH